MSVLLPVKQLVFRMAPNGLLRLLGKTRPDGHLLLRGPYPDWDSAQRDSTGYDAGVILERALAASLKVHRGEAVHERDTVLLPRIEYSWPLLAGLMWVAAQNRGRLCVVDIGGALGSTFMQNRRFLAQMPELAWHVVEQPHFAAAGRQHLQTNQLLFHDSLERCLSAATPNVAVLSGLLQYLQDPMPMLDTLWKAGVEHLLIDILPVADSPEHAIFVQDVHPDVYPASYPIRIFSRERLRDQLQGYTVVERFDSTDSAAVRYRFEGLILKRVDNG